MTKKPKEYKPLRSKAKQFTLKKNARQKGYNSQWEGYRRRFLHHNPHCYCCPNEANVVDHIKVHRGDQELFESTVNHLPLCKHCHDTITGKFDRHKVQLLDEKLEWIRNQKEKFNNTKKVKVLPYYNKKDRYR